MFSSNLRTFQRKKAISHELPRSSSFRGAQHTRTFSSSKNSLPSDSLSSHIPISKILGALLAVGVAATAWGLYEFYATLTMWPKEVRGDLRSGLRAKERDDLKLSQRHLMKAWEVVRTLPSSALSPEPYLKISGIAIVLAEVLEADREFEQAYAVLSAAIALLVPSLQVSSSPSPSSSSSSSSPSGSTGHEPPVFRSLRSSPSGVTGPEEYSAAHPTPTTRERMRAVALALKLGDMAEMLARPAEEEHWLSYAMEEVLRVVRDEYDLVPDTRRGGFINTDSAPSASQKTAEEKGESEDSAVKSVENRREQSREHALRDVFSPGSENAQLGLPAWVSLTKTELVAPIERLASFYARQGKAGPAITLYRVASNLLVQPKAQNKRPPVPAAPAELCQALQVECAHMALLMALRRQRPDNPMLARDIPRVMQRAMNLYSSAHKAHGSPKDGEPDNGAELALCDQTYTAVLFNAAIYYEELGQLEDALRCYSLSNMGLRSLGNRAQAQEAQEGMRRVQGQIDTGRNRESPP
ncbi:hypothetical protein DFH11DRAFT_1509828 [Phellopilus nigrolimitatus]|nr:hypothetical protein DFH11DRAFT_1509828 [Phellopilus nigrolimitatus]